MDHRSKIDVKPYLIIFIIILVFNIYAAVGLDSLLNDDLGKYSDSLHDRLAPLLDGQGRMSISFIHLFKWPLRKSMLISPKLSRFLLLFLYIIPSSFTFYFLYRNIFKIPKLVAITASVLPYILPGQLNIPSFIDGSYTAHGLLLNNISLIIGFYYIKSKENTTKLFFCFFLLYFVAANCMQLAIFLSLPIICALLLFHKLNKRTLIAISYVILLTLINVCYSLIHQIPTVSEVTKHSFRVLNHRVYKYFYSTDPFLSAARDNHITFVVYVLMISSVILFTLKRENVGFIKLKKKNFLEVFNYVKENNHALIVIAYSIIWSISTAAFIMISYNYTSRHCHVSSFGYCLFLTYFFYLFFRNVLAKNKKYLVLIFCIMIVFSGVIKNFKLISYFKPFNYEYHFLRNDLEYQKMPENSQIVLVGKLETHTFGYWMWSSGFLQYLTKRKDLNGLMPYEYNYYDSFNVKHRGYEQRMIGLDITRPVFLFRIVDNKIEQLEYGLRWEDENSINSNWTICRFDKKTGKTIIFRDGKGFDEYYKVLDKLKKLGIGQRDILWGAHPNEKEKERLGLMICSK